MGEVSVASRCNSRVRRSAARHQRLQLLVEVPRRQVVRHLDARLRGVELLDRDIVVVRAARRDTLFKQLFELEGLGVFTAAGSAGAKHEVHFLRLSHAHLRRE